MDTLPPELVRCILAQSMRLCWSNKNELMQLRLVCRRFNAILREYVCKTTQLEFSRLVRGESTPDTSIVPAFGRLVQALHCDMMVIRDQEELDRLSTVFNPIFDKLPEMRTLIDHLSAFCLTEGRWNEANFRQIMDAVLQNTPNLTRVKLNLPFQVIGRTSQTATLLLANTFDCLASRPTSEDFKRLETLVIDHITDATIVNICRNPIDLRNALRVFEKLKNLVITIKVQESSNPLIQSFGNNLWYLISEAQSLESLCIIGWCTKRTSTRRRREMRHVGTWASKNLPYDLNSKRHLPNLRCLELKRIDVNPNILLRLVADNAESLKELYLNEVHLKVLGGRDGFQTSLWIGHHPSIKKGPNAVWVAEELRQIEGLKLDVFRVSNLGYDNFDADRTHGENLFDLQDPLSLDRSFDERFVATYLGIEPEPPTPPRGALAPSPPPGYDASSQTINPALLTLTDDEDDEGEQTTRVSRTMAEAVKKVKHRRKMEWDAETYQRNHNTTSRWKQCIDGHFQNHNQKALLELDKIIKVADRGMDLLSADEAADEASWVRLMGNLLAVRKKADEAKRRITHLYATPLENVQARREG